MKTVLWLASALAALAGPQAPSPAPADARTVHIVLVGDSTVTEGSGWGLGFRQLAGPGVTITNTAQNGRSSKSFRDEGHWAKALALKGHYYLIQFGHNDQPGKGPERETDPSTTYPANMARYVDEVRGNGGVPILVTSLVRRTFADRKSLSSTLDPWVIAVKRVALEKQVPLVDLDASSRELCERLGPAETHGFDIKKDDGTWDTTHLDAAGSLVFARLVVEELRRVVPALSPLFREDTTATLDEPTDLPLPLPLLTGPEGRGDRVRIGRVYTRELRLERYRRLAAHRGGAADLARLPPVVTSPAILVAWDYDRFGDGWAPGCGFAPDAPTHVEIRRIAAPPGTAPPDIQPLAVTFDRKRIRELLEPYERHVEQTQWLAVLDPDRLRAGTLLLWVSTKPCASSSRWSESPAFIYQSDIDRWLTSRPSAHPIP